MTEQEVLKRYEIFKKAKFCFDEKEWAETQRDLRKIIDQVTEIIQESKEGCQLIKDSQQRIQECEKDIKESERHFKAEWTRIGKADILLDEIGRQLQAMTDRYEFVQEYLWEAERDGKEDKEL